RSVHGLEGRGAGLVAQQEVFAMLREIGRDHMAHFGVTAHERIYLDRAGEVIQRHHMPQTQLSWDALFRTFREHFPADRYEGGRNVVGVEYEGAGVLRYADGTREQADVIIGADGIGSQIRAAVVGSESR